MFSLNGTGIRLLGAKSAMEPGIKTGTKWITFFFLPLIPIGRIKIKPSFRNPVRFDFTVVSKTPFDFAEILKTYLFGWIIIPVAGFAPLVPAIREVRVFLSLPEWIEIPWILCGIAWIVVLAWKLKDWDENRWFK